MTNNFFQQLPPEVSRTGQRRKLELGNVLFRERAAIQSIYYVECGCIRMVVHPIDGKELVLYRAQDEEFIAEDHLTRKTNAFTAIADKKTIVVSFCREAFVDHVTSDRDTMFAYLQMLGVRSEKVRQNFARLALPRAADKVMHLLRGLDNEDSMIDLSGRFKTLASDLNMTHETMYRTLRTLEEDGVISRSDGLIRLLQ